MPSTTKTYRLTLLIHGENFHSREVQASNSDDALAQLGYDVNNTIGLYATVLEFRDGDGWAVSYSEDKSPAPSR